MLRRRARSTRIFFAADIHGSQPTFRKFVNAAAFYDCDALVFGGDLMGKALVPIVRTHDGYRARFDGRDQRFEQDGLADFVRTIETPGYYWKVLEPDDYTAVRDDPFAKIGLFQELASERLAEWLALAEDRLAGTGVRMYLTGGNDDDPVVLETLDGHRGDHVEAAEGKVVDLDGEHTMITVGLSTETPWETPREADEDEIATWIDRSVAAVPDPGRCVFNLHCPPKDTLIDTCLKLEKASSPETMPTPIRDGGRFLTTGGGSVAVREAVARYQPVVGLHGHIHESLGRVRIGRTPCFNPGSEYLQGQLQGWIVGIRDGAVRAYQHTSG